MQEFHRDILSLYVRAVRPVLEYTCMAHYLAIIVILQYRNYTEKDIKMSFLHWVTLRYSGVLTRIR